MNNLNSARHAYCCMLLCHQLSHRQECAVTFMGAAITKGLNVFIYLFDMLLLSRVKVNIDFYHYMLQHSKAILVELYYQKVQVCNTIKSDCILKNIEVTCAFKNALYLFPQFFQFFYSFKLCCIFLHFFHSHICAESNQEP